MKSRWVIDSGTLHMTVAAPTMEQAVIRAIKRAGPRSIGRLVRGRKLCCRKVNHAPHFIHHWLDPIHTMRRAGLLL